jgi:aminodeoxychorismate synthase component I
MPVRFSTASLSEALASAAATGEPFALIDDASGQRNSTARLLTDPFRIIAARRTDDAGSAIDEAQSLADAGFRVAGYVAYEAASAFDPAIKRLSLTDDGRTLVWFGAFKKETECPFCSSEPPHLPAWHRNEPVQIHSVALTDSYSDYERKIRRIKDYIASGDTYQVNLTSSLKFNYAGSPTKLYLWLRSKQTAQYGALIRTEDETILSFSPELFFQLDRTPDNRRAILSKPMKGTLARQPSATNNDDDDAARALASDEKNRAENTMIVDLIRNDFGRICRTGSVSVRDLYRVETYPTLYQMTSTVEGELNADARIRDVFEALFPCGSITGAPKLRTMAIINELERRARGVYTGAVGMILPGGLARFNVAIRTVEIDSFDASGGLGRMGVGGGIIWDSTPESEYQEMLTKAAFLGRELLSAKEQ